MRLPLFLSLSFLLLLGCRKNDSEPKPPRYEVDDAAEPYVRAFGEEARQRGKIVDLSNLIVQFGTVTGDNVCGECLLVAGEPPRVVLNQDGLCWKTASNEAREGLLFHELGHCLLKRAHKTTRLPNGAYASLMNGEDVGVYAPCLYPIGGDECDKRPRRSYYLDELFDEKTPVPAWGR